MSTINWLRGPKLIGIAVFDVLATLAGAFVVSGAIKKLNRFEGYTHVFIVFILLIIIGIGVHVVMDIPTMFNHYIGINTLDEVKKSRLERGETVEI